jgi:peptidoglycan/LPS O-acetylase OafA/YrhL
MAGATADARAPLHRGRIPALEGLRGLAALGVVLTHALLASIHYVKPYSSNWFYPVWLGDEAVIIFFVLSGFVLTLPLASGRRFQAASYYVSRFARLYLPVWGAVAFAALLHAIGGWHAIKGASWWLNLHATPLTFREAAHDLTLFKAVGASYFLSIWTLWPEIIFSVLLPVFVWLAVCTRQLTWLAILAALGVIASAPNFYAQMLPVFFLGVVLAFHYGAVQTWWSSRSARVSMITLAAGVACLTSDWWLGTNNQDSPALVASGAAFVVALAIVSVRFDAVLVRRPVRWLGSRSFSLYLVHEPVVVTLYFAMGGKPAPVLFVLLATPLALIASELFFRVVESPSHRIARQLGAHFRLDADIRQR